MKLRKLHLLIVVLVGLLAGTVLLRVHAAGSASLSLSPASGSHDNGTNFTVTINENSSDQVNTVEADLTYDQSKLQFVSIDTAGSGFDFAISATGGSGSVQIARGVSGGGTVTSTQKVASVTFKALVGSGTSSVSFANSSAIVRPSDGQNVWNGTTTGGTYTLTTPAAPPSGGGGGSSSGSGAGTPSPGSSSSSSSSQIKTPATTTKTTTTTVTPAATAQQTADPAAPVATSKDVSVADAKYLVAVKVVDSNNKVIEGASVTLNGQTAKSDKTGVASFANVKPGSYNVAISSSKGSVKGAVTVSSTGDNATAQSFTLKVKKSTPWMVIIGGGLAAAIVIITIISLIKRYNRNRPFASSSSSGSGPALDPQEDQPVHGPAVAPGRVIHPTSTNTEK